MIETIAQLPSPQSAEGIGWLMVSLAALALAVNQIAGVIDRIRGPRAGATTISPNPLTVQAAVAFASKEEHENLAGEVAAIREDIQGGFERIEDKRSASIGNLHEKLEKSLAEMRKETAANIYGVHERINDVLAAVSRLEGRQK